MKKISLLSFVFLLAVFALSAVTQAAGLLDVSSHKNRTAIEYLNQNGIVQGYSDGTYKPDTSINRAEFTKIIIEATYDSATIESCLENQMQPNWTYAFFPDVDRNDWYAKYVCVAKINNIVSGYEDGLFRPENQINKAESIKILVTSQGYTVPESVSENTYSDVLPNDWFAPYVKVAFDANLIEDTGSSALNAGKALTRGDMSEMTYRALVSEEGKFEIQEVATESSTPSSKISTSKKITTVDPELAQAELIQVLKDLLSSETNSDEAILSILDSPEISYLKNLETISSLEFGNQLDVYGGDEETDEWLAKSHKASTPSASTIFLSEVKPTNSSFTSRIKDETIYVGLTGKINLTEELDTDFFICHPFIYDGFWKLKLPTEFYEEVGFSDPGIIESCSNKISSQTLLKEEDFHFAKLEFITSYASRIFINDILVKEANRGHLYAETYLPLKIGNNILKVESIHSPNFEQSWEGVSMTKEEFAKSFEIEPDEIKVQIDKDGESLIDFSMLKSEGSKTVEFDYQP